MPPNLVQSVERRTADRVRMDGTYPLRTSTESRVASTETEHQAPSIEYQTRCQALVKAELELELEPELELELELEYRVPNPNKVPNKVPGACKSKQPQYLNKHLARLQLAPLLGPYVRSKLVTTKSANSCALLNEFGTHRAFFVMA